MLKKAIILLQDYLKSLGYTAQIHFELEGCYKTRVSKQAINFTAINRVLLELGIDGEVVNEYWKNQWEYVSLFNGQSPLKEAENLEKAMSNLPTIFAKHGMYDTLIQPVVWSGDQGRLAVGSDDIFTTDTRAVHIPNAIQINVSVLNKQGVNIIPDGGFGEFLQQCFLQTSKTCSLLYLPEEDAFERFKLTSYYGLAQELCSPCDISGGHQGSVALYKEVGKHNQLMGEEHLFFDQHNNALLTQHNWQKTARIEHRLGASSLAYNPYANVLFALANIIDAIEVYQDNRCQSALLPSTAAIALPESLYNKTAHSENNTDNNLGAIALFTECHWLSNCINNVQMLMEKSTRLLSYQTRLGDLVKQQILAQYQHKKIQLPFNFNQAKYNKI